MSAGASRTAGALLVSIILALNLGGCLTVQGYEGERRSADEVARITGDFRVTAGAPVSVILRQVDDRVLNAGERSVDVLAGEHRLLVDCRIAETDSVSRHAIDVTVFEGRRYKLRAQPAAGLRGCENVFLEAVR